MLIVFLRGAVREHALPASGRVVIGRDATADISIGDSSVSSRHAALDISDSGLTITDLGSANGVRIGTPNTTSSGTSKDDRIAPDTPVTITLSDQFFIGNVLCSLRRSDVAPTSERARGRVGTTVDGKWHLDELLGVGGMACVYGATHRNGTRAAIKVLNPDIALNTDAKTRFLREGYVANKIGHPRVVLVQDDDEAPDGTVYLVMELLEGQTLQGVIAEGKTLGTKEVLRIARDVLEVLEAAHAKDVVHRDLKPGNLFLLRDGTVKLLDFGVAKVRESTVVGVPNVTTLSAMGTPGFMPPEQARGRWDSVDGRADLWALGATMFALLSRRYVHEEETPNEQLLAAMTKPAPKLREAMPEAPDAVADLVDRALAFDREERFPDAASMKRAVEAALAELEDAPEPKDEVAASAKLAPKTPITAGAIVSDVATKKSSNLRWVGIVGVAAGALGLFVLFGREGSKKAGTAPMPVATSTTESAAASPATASAPAAPAPLPVVVENDPPAPSASTSASVATKPAVKPRPPVTTTTSTAVASVAASTPPAPTPAPSPAASVDIFNKRH